MSHFRRAINDDIESLDILSLKVFDEKLQICNGIDSYIVVILDDDIIGFTELVIDNIYEYKKDFTIACKNYQVNSFAIDPKYRRLGIGTDLFTYLLKQLEYYKGVVRIELLIDDNSVSTSFWGKNIMENGGNLICLDNNKYPDIYGGFGFLDIDDFYYFAYIVKHKD